MGIVLLVLVLASSFYCSLDYLHFAEEEELSQKSVENDTKLSSSNDLQLPNAVKENV